MATTTKNVETLDVTIVNQEMAETVFKINNPRSAVTLAQIREAYQGIMGQSVVTAPGDPANSHFFDKNGKAYVFVSAAKITKVVTTSTDVS